MTAAAAGAALALAGLPGTALAQPFVQQAEEYGPGITISGAGLARVAAPSRPSEPTIRRAIEAAHPSAVARAVRDAHRRAQRIGAAADVPLGEVEAIELRDAFPDRGRHCRQTRSSGRLRCTVPAFTAASATVTFAIVGGAEPTEGAREVAASGVASAPVEPQDRFSDQSIRRALVATRREVTPEAASAARANAETAARVAGLTLGPIVSIAEQLQPYPYFFEPALGGYGPRKFCRTFRRPVARRDPTTGRFRVIRRVPRRRCFFPRTFSVSLEASFLAE